MRWRERNISLVRSLHEYIVSWSHCGTEGDGISAEDGDDGKRGREKAKYVVLHELCMYKEITINTCIIVILSFQRVTSPP